MYKEKHNKVTFTIPASIEVALREIAEKTGLKLSTIVAKALEAYIKDYEKKN